MTHMVAINNKQHADLKVTDDTFVTQCQSAPCSCGGL